MKSAADMTMDEFRDELQRIRELTMDFSDSKVGTKQDRRYGDNMKRGNFHGNAQKNAREQLKQLGINVKSNGDLKRGKWDG